MLNVKEEISLRNGRVWGRLPFAGYLQHLDPDGWSAQILAGFVGSVALTPLRLLPVLVYTYSVVLEYGAGIAGWISSGALAGLAGATVLVSLYAKRWCMGRVSVAGMVIMLVFTALTLVFQQPLSLFLLTLLAGFGGGLTQAAVAAALSRTCHAERAFAIFTFFQFVYTSLGALLLPRLIMWSGFGFDAVQLGLVAMIISAFILAPVVTGFKLADTLPGYSGMTTGIFGVIRQIVYLPALLSVTGIMVYGISNGAVFAYLEAIGHQAGLNAYDSNDIIAYANLIAGVAALAVIWVGDRIGHYIPLVFGILGQLASILIFYIWPVANIYVAGVIVFNIACAITWAYFLSSQAGLDNSGTVVAFGQFTNLAGTTLGPAIAAFFIGARGELRQVLWVSAILTILALIPMVIVPVMLWKQRVAAV
ncbi:MAG: Major facilitator family transporter [Candidatus Tokpelaia hoelldobleri]|uniref:Major facilitator family transporter n=1 Tax=Candidatus Tokpelaia hoelldobleri TaxID=1902579 RepID=A0A1U9JSC5_9HYPH|nr:MAG: Major facilitator family transporter [Candidatus Tokpelaia hoelldoblerii]